MARATSKASAARPTRTRAASKVKPKPSKKAQPKASAKKAAPRPASAKSRASVKKTSPKKTAPKKPATKVAGARKNASPPKKAVKQVTSATKAGKKTVSAKKAAARPAKTAAKPQRGAVEPVGKTVKKTTAPAPAKAEAVKPPKKQERPMEPIVVEEAPKKPRKRELTAREVQNIRAQLEEQRENLLREYNEIEDSATISQSEMSGEVSFDEEYADAGTFTFERERDLSIGNNIRDLLDKVNAAITAIDAGTYGFCENCGDPINKARLIALPSSTLCIRCKQIEERTR